MAKLKVFGGIVFIRGEQRRAIVASTSRKEAARIVGCSMHEINHWWAETGNKAEVKVALGCPGVLFHAELDRSNARIFERVVTED